MLLCVLSCWDPGFLGTSLKNGFSSQCPSINVKLVTSTNLNMTSCYLCTCRMYLLSYTSILASNRRQVTETKTAGSSHLSICATFEICQLQTSPANNGNPLQRFDHGGSKKRWWGGRCSSPPLQAWYSWGSSGANSTIWSTRHAHTSQVSYAVWTCTAGTVGRGEVYNLETSAVLLCHGDRYPWGSHFHKFLWMWDTSGSCIQYLRCKWIDKKCSSRISCPPRFLSHFCLWSP